MVTERQVAQLIAAANLGQFEQAAARLPNPGSYGDNLRRLGDILHRAGYHREAIAYYDQALRQTPAPRDAVFNRAVAHKKLDDLRAATAGFTASITLFPGWPLPLQMLAEVDFLERRYDDAIANLDRALAFGEDSMLRYRRNKALLARENQLDDPAQVFANIYAHHAWGNDRVGRRFYSGDGSHTPETVAPYVEAVNGFLRDLGGQVDVVDVGCGDFNIGSQIYQSCGRYQAFDVVPDLVTHNAAAFAHTGVTFAALDITRDTPPHSDVLFIREVFQHLSNDQIARALANIEGRYGYFVFTEVEPKTPFTPNKDKPAGENIRMNLNQSAVVLTEAPFNQSFSSERLLCVVERKNDRVKTYVYTP
jgi:tetratricopeptide (TPR) repeat protein